MHSMELSNGCLSISNPGRILGLLTRLKRHDSMWSDADTPHMHGQSQAGPGLALSVLTASESTLYLVGQAARQDVLQLLYCSFCMADTPLAENSVRRLDMTSWTGKQEKELLPFNDERQPNSHK